MKQLSIAFVSGFLFGAGLLISRMSDPAKVLNFLNVAEQWDPSLALVIAGALPLAAAGYVVARSRPRALDGSCFPSLPRGGISPRLVLGALIFGVGWALVGFCPGPALVALPVQPEPVAFFVLAMLLGLWAARLFSTKPDHQAPPSDIARRNPETSAQKSR